MKLSIIIVNWNTRDLLQRCLASLQQFPPCESYEVIVVDNDSADGSAEMVRQQFSQVNLIVPGGNTGYAAGNNIGFAHATGDFLLTLNPDTEFEDDSLARALAELERRPEAGCLSIKLIGIEGELQKSVRGFPTPAGVFGALSGLDKAFPNSSLGRYTLPRFDCSASQWADQPMGTFLLFRREALRDAGDDRKPFDEGFPIFFNEVDLLYRMHQAGWKCWHMAEAHVRHHHGASTKQVRKSMIWESHRSLVRYFQKHLRGVARIQLPLIAAAAWVAAFVRARGWNAGFRPDDHNLQLEHGR